MAKKLKDLKRSAPQLRRMTRSWRQGVLLHLGLAAVAALAVSACRYLDAHWFWWFVSITALLSGMIGVFADVNAYYDTKKSIAATEEELDAHGFAVEPVRGNEERQ
jgi:uncharacterized membrane protein YfcA